jgi:MYXO-CTERM domain-containing protein
VEADTIGPPALANMKVESGDTRLLVSWTGVGEAGVNDAALISLFYSPAKANIARAVRSCPEGGAADTDAGDETEATSKGRENTERQVDTDSPVDAAVADADACVDLVIPGSCGGDGFEDNADGTFRVVTGKASSAQVDRIAAQAVIDGLENERTYVVGAAATDSFLNVGPMTKLECAAPQSLNDFFETYRNAGGQAGGCELSSTPPAGSAVVLGLASMVLVGWLRRRRRLSEARPGARRGATSR